MKIGFSDFDNTTRPYLIAEAGSNHQGDQEVAIAMARAAVKMGGDALTYQEIDECRLYSLLLKLPVDSQKTIGWDCLKECRRIVKQANMSFSVCVTDIDSLEKALSIGIDFIKIVSYDVTFNPFLEICGHTKLPILLSTGASTFDEIDKALKLLNADDRTLLYNTDCGYPTVDQEVNLNRMLSLKQRFGLPVGHCDHTDHGLSCLLAAGLGALIIEKHFTMDRSKKGSDWEVSFEPEELTSLFHEIKRVRVILGNGEDKIQSGDEYRRRNLRRSLALKRSLKRGEIIQESDLDMLRPGTLLSWEEKDKLIGKSVTRDLKARELISPEDLQSS